MDEPIFKDGFYIYPDGQMIPESDAIEGISKFDNEPEEEQDGNKG